MVITKVSQFTYWSVNICICPKTSQTSFAEFPSRLENWWMLPNLTGMTEDRHLKKSTVKMAIKKEKKNIYLYK